MSSRARALYTYDPGGRVTSLEHYWDSWGGSTFSSEAVLANACSYENTGLKRGLKTSSSFYAKDPANPALFALERTETYGYDSDLDYLTGATYGDGLPNANPTWSYDAAGNRNDCTVVDNLNRATTIGGVSRTYDILGNTTAMGSSKTMTWDALNRMLSHTASSLTTTYAYRADGMRVSKVSGSVTDLFRYDGQMPVETSTHDSSAGTTTVNRNGLGARGIDYMSTTTSQGTNVGYPVYDAHGNMVATLAKSGSGYVVSNRRAFDAWGGIRQGASSGDPKGRYCASIGHVHDDESGLVFMRARYYEPASGRFLTEDPGWQGRNWYSYCNGDPLQYADFSGKLYDIAQLLKNAWDIFYNCRQWGYGSLETLTKLRNIRRLLLEASDYFRSDAERMLTDAEVEEETAPYEGSAGLIQEKLAELEVAASVRGRALAVVAKLGARMVAVMIEMIRNENPWDVGL